MQSAFFSVLDESGPGGAAAHGVYRSSHSAVGPWDPRHLHGGPPAALLVRAVERLGHAPQPGLVARATLDLWHAVPGGDLVVEARVLRAGRRVALCEATLSALPPAGGPHRRDDPEPGEPLARLTAWRLRTTPDALPLPATPGQPAPPVGHQQEVPAGWDGGYLRAVEWHWAAGSFGEPGPATVWTRLLVPLVAGEEPSPAQRVLAVADSGSGISSVLDPQRTLFVNTELTVHLHRAPRGDRVWLQSTTTLDPHGVGLATTVVGDVDGSVGSGAQTLFVQPR